MDKDIKNTIIKEEVHVLLDYKEIELVPVKEEHLDFVCKVECDKELWCYEESIETDREKIRETFRKRISNNFVFDYVVRRKEDGEFLGLVYIWSVSLSRGSWEIGYVMLPQFQRNGYTLKSTKCLLEFAFKKLDAHKVLGMCNCNNEGSVAIMKKLNMTRRAVFKEEYICNGEWVDQFYFSILKSEYLENHK